MTTRSHTTVPTAEPIPRRPPPAVDPVALAVAVATAYVEVRDHRRPVQQLRPLLTRSAYRRVRAMVLRTRHRHVHAGGTSVRTVRTCRPTPDAVEATVVLRDGHGVLAVAVRCDRHEGRWWVTDLGSPQDRTPLGPVGGEVSPPPRGTA